MNQLKRRDRDCVDCPHNMTDGCCAVGEDVTQCEPCLFRYACKSRVKGASFRDGELISLTLGYGKMRWKVHVDGAYYI